MAEHPSARQIEYFLAIAEAHSFRGAAARLRITQPTLSGQISALEALLNVQLFERSRGGTLVTPAGTALIPSARRVLEEHRAFLDRVMELSAGPGGTYRLGVTPTLGPYLLPHILPPIHAKYPALKLYVREGLGRDLEHGLLAGEYDLILTPTASTNPSLQVTPLFREPLHLVMSSEHRLANRKRVLREDMRGENVLTLGDQYQLHATMAQVCERLGAQLMRDYEGTSLDTLRHMVVMGMGVAFLPALYIRSEIHRPKELRIKKLQGEVLERDLSIAWRHTSSARTLFRDLAAQIRRTVSLVLDADVLPPHDAGRKR